MVRAHVGDCKIESDRGTVIEDVHGETSYGESVNERLGSFGQLSEVVAITFSIHPGKAKRRQVGSNQMKAVREQRHQVPKVVR